MNYDKKMLEAWAGMASWEEFLRREGAFNNVSQEVWNFIQSKYFRIVQRRIEHCKKLLEEYDDWFILYTLAELYDRGNLDNSTEQLYKRPVRYWCIKTIRKNPVMLRRGQFSPRHTSGLLVSAERVKKCRL